MSVRIAVLGAGRIGQVHARAIAGHDAAVLAAIADPIVAAANVIADQYGCDVRTIDEIAASDDVDGLIINIDQFLQFIRQSKMLSIHNIRHHTADRLRHINRGVNPQIGIVTIQNNVTIQNRPRGIHHRIIRIIPVSQNSINTCY